MPFSCNTAKWDGTKPPNYNATSYCNRLPYYTPELIDIRAGLRDSIDPMIQASLGLCGTPEYLSGTQTSAAGYFYCAIVCLKDTTLNVSAGNTAEVLADGVTAIDLADLSLQVLPAGTILNGTFSKVVLASGLVKLLPHPFLNP